MIKLNNKGFALAEALVTAVFVMVIFSIIYTNYTPIMADYERRETYDDIDGKYAAYWMKKMIENSGTTAASINFSDANACSNYFSAYKETCEELVKNLNTYTEVDINNVALNEFKKASFNCDVINNPTCIIVGGQPGSGKSTRINEIIDSFDNNIIDINMDLYREYHPNYEWIVNTMIH